jgi:glycosyltransferase involved in cell wall biosynthesis
VISAHYGLSGAIAVAQRNVPTVVTYHAGDLESVRWQRQVSRLVYRLAADNIAVSSNALRRLPGPAHHVTCGVDLSAFAPLDRVTARAQFGVAPDELAVLFPSSPERPEKGYDRYSKVMAELRRRGHRVRELQLRSLRRVQVPTIMAAADVMLLTSHYEGSPVSVMEALACGLGVVATPAGDVPAMLASARNARVSAFDAIGFADAVEQVAGADVAVRIPDPESRRFATSEITERVVAILEGARSARAASPVSR